MRAVVGRELELGLVSRFLAGLDEDPGALLIEGEAGIGKTAIWLEALTLAGARGCRVLQARPAETEAKLSFAALADLLGDAFEEMRGSLPLPQEAALAGALLRVATAFPPDARTTATGALGAVTALAADSVVVIAIDDVQWLDAATARTIEFVARRLPQRVGLLLTRRGDGRDDLPLDLASALPEAAITRVVPAPLSLATLHHLISERVGLSLARPRLARIAAASGGNPLFALELARAVADARSERPLDDPLPVPRRLEEIVAARVVGLTRGAREAVLVAAALFRPTIATVLDALGSEIDGAAALVEAEEAGIVVIEGDRLRFTHPVLASVVYGSSSLLRRRELHRVLAARAEHAEERARHLAQSVTRPDEVIATQIESGASEAAQRGAQDAAAELFEAACRLTPPEESDGSVRRLLGAAVALLTVGDEIGARGFAERALATSRTPSSRADALERLAAIDWAEGAMSDASRRLEAALELVNDERAVQGRIHAQLARFNSLVDPERAGAHAEKAVQLLDELDAPGLLGSALIDRFFTEVLLGGPPRTELWERGLELEARAGPGGLVHPLPLVWFHFTDDFEAARLRYAQEERHSRAHGLESGLADRVAHLGMVELRAGRWELAERYLDESCGSVTQTDSRGPTAMRFAFRALVDAHRGRTDRARATLLPLIAMFEETGQLWWSAMALSVLGFVEFAAGAHAESDHALTRMRERVESHGVQEAPLDRSEPFHIESLLVLGELERARFVLARLERRALILPRPWIDVALPRARALVLAAQNDLEHAVAAFDDLDRSVAARLPFEYGWTLLVEGRMLRRIRQKQRAAETLQQACALFEQVGAPTWTDQARVELARVGLRRASANELTSTERHVAELAAGGLTNREVATAAFMSPKTVEANLARVYRKLGIRSRAELGARMTTLGRVPPPQT